MKMKSWQTTIGGAFTALGTALMGIGIVPQLTGEPNKMLSHIAIAGFIFNGLGQFFSHLFAADDRQIRQLTETVNDNTRALISGDNSELVPPKASK